ncbi:putative SAM-dependent methyltransferase [Desulforapulum autotrophicum HRM2]|uniref:SAM-dependent methyltransferase n=1 Tax=Desulforapulum autotrophicum (strain ATCC 43914 / DSM 3382 / VKM B-1955 / HRM2) TaxID=177437 RepID=C0QMC2_DESAH|nr:class I SAM-dependent methyltransferase [Desulforapulum autotrophicum]ACN16439.1 putative SAM-dependent methyltransferase [Desulforapulum autotrophicum HRM2]
MNLFPLQNQTVWKDLWQKELKNDPETKKSQDHIKKWDQRAPSFDKRTVSPEAVLRKERILSMLEDAGALQAGNRILDIGSGPGNWAIPMVEMGAEVVAVEPSGGMVKILKEKMAAKGIHSDQLRIDQRAWQDVDVEKEGLSGQFDLVFASMSPGVRDPETLNKAMKASRKFCYLSTFSGGGWRSCYNNLWQSITGQVLESSSWDFIYPFSYVYALGYRPQIDFNVWTHDRDETIDEAVENISFFVQGAVDVTPEIREKLKAHVTSQAVDGIFHQKQTICQGVMLWQIA